MDGCHFLLLFTRVDSVCFLFARFSVALLASCLSCHGWIVATVSLDSPPPSSHNRLTPSFAPTILFIFYPPSPSPPSQLSPSLTREAGSSPQTAGGETGH